MTQRGAIALGEHGGKPDPALAQAGVTDCVHAPADRVRRPVPTRESIRAASQAQPEELPPGDDAVLSPG
jgi:hypothetical protein